MCHPQREQQELHVLRAAVPERGSPQGETRRKWPLHSPAQPNAWGFVKEETTLTSNVNVQASENPKDFVTTETGTPFLYFFFAIFLRNQSALSTALLALPVRFLSVLSSKTNHRMRQSPELLLSP